MFKFLTKSEFAKMLVESDPEKFKNYRIAKKYIKSGAIGKIQRYSGDLERKILELDYIPKTGEKFSLYNGTDECPEKYLAIEKVAGGVTLVKYY